MHRWYESDVKRPGDRTFEPRRWCFEHLVISGCVFLSVACSKTTPEPTPTATSASIASATTTPPVASASSAATADGGVPLSPDLSQTSIPDRFAREAAHRPLGVPRVEDVFAAYKKAGVDVHDEKQHLGAPFLAQYCVGFEAGVDIHGSVCEHKDEATAIKGRDASDKGFMAVPNRKVYRNGGSTLILREGVVSPPNDALVKKMVATFQAQKPSAGPPPVGSAPSPFAGASAAPMPSDQPLP